MSPFHVENQPSLSCVNIISLAAITAIPGRVSLCHAWTDSFRASDLVSQRCDGLQGLHGGVAVIFLFGLGQVGIGDEIGVLLLLIVALRTVGPSIRHPLSGPDIVCVLRELLRQCLQIV